MIAREPGTAHTDLGNAERLVARHGQDLRYVSQWGWLAWDGRRWERDTTGESVRRAKETARHMLAEATTLESTTERQLLAKHALASERAGPIPRWYPVPTAGRPMQASPTARRSADPAHDGLPAARRSRGRCGRSLALERS